MRKEITREEAYITIYQRLKAKDMSEIEIRNFFFDKFSVDIAQVRAEAKRNAKPLSDSQKKILNKISMLYKEIENL